MNDSGDLKQDEKCRNPELTPSPSSLPSSTPFAPAEKDSSIGVYIGVGFTTVIVTMIVLSTGLLLLRSYKKQKDRKSEKQSRHPQRYIATFLFIAPRDALPIAICTYSALLVRNPCVTMVGNPSTYLYGQISGILLFLGVKSRNTLPTVNLEERTARIPSTYIRQMVDEKLLIPGRALTLMDTVGQGKRSLHSVVSDITNYVLRR